MINTANLQLLAASIIKHQQDIIGSLALEQAQKVPGIEIIDSTNINIKIDVPDPKLFIQNLVSKYEELFGSTSIEVCKDAIKTTKLNLRPEDLPEILH